MFEGLLTRLQKWVRRNKVELFAYITGFAISGVLLRFLSFDALLGFLIGSIVGLLGFVLFIDDLH